MWGGPGLRKRGQNVCAWCACVIREETLNINQQDTQDTQEWWFLDLHLKLRQTSLSGIVPKHMQHADMCNHTHTHTHHWDWNRFKTLRRDYNLTIRSPFQHLLTQTNSNVIVTCSFHSFSSCVQNLFQSSLASQLPLNPVWHVFGHLWWVGTVNRLKMSIFTCFQSFWSRVTLLVTLTAPHLHQLGMEGVQHVPVHWVHRIGQLHR